MDGSLKRYIFGSYHSVFLSEIVRVVINEKKECIVNIPVVVVVVASAISMQ